MSEKVQWTVFRHAMESFGIEDVMVDSGSGWSAERREEFAGAVGALVRSLALLKELGGVATQADERGELLAALLDGGLPRGAVLRGQQPAEAADGATAATTLVLLALERGALELGEEVFADWAARQDEGEAVLAALEQNDEELLLATDCTTAGAALLLLLRRMQQQNELFPSAEECARGASDWSRAEESLMALSSKRANTLVLVAAFFRLFRGFDVMGALFGAEHHQIQLLQDFFVLFLRHMPAHGVLDGAAGYNAIVTSKNTKKQAKGVVTGVDKTDRFRYVVKIGGGQQVRVFCFVWWRLF